ncbi:hypothetical protein AAFF_G00418010 [Aldrovandia affinis]|uniref:TM7S3/TM198-like domain-containing protein n=1 Tax=Aldrovandia affinis TaxID=143900 RepID=A0AAD7WJA9_9TELE|nr:hypothetical protein AAFF_G00418010 [Aldrovandia affinis]
MQASACIDRKKKGNRCGKMSHFWTLPVILIIFTWAAVLSQDANSVVFSLGTFRNVTVPQNATVQAVVSRIPQDITYITLQFHTQHLNATLSYSLVPLPGSAYTAADSGLLSPLLPLQTSLTWYLLSPDGDRVAGMGVILPYRTADPVPGGCQLEPDLSIDPNVHLRYNLFETSIRFALANIGYARGTSPPACNVTSGRLEYEVYQYLLPAGDLSEQTLLDHIQTAINMQSLRDHGKKVATLSVTDGTSMSFSSVPGQGVIYSVIVRDAVLNTSASYIPAHTYSCSFSSTLDGCLTLGKISTKVFFTLGGLAGLFICFFGHRFFKCELFCMGYAFAAFVFFILITRTTVLDYDIRLALTALMGVVGGVLLVLSWWRFGSVMACVVVVGLILGFLVAAIIFYTPLGDLEVFRTGMVFWATFSCIMLVVPLVFVRWPREGNITTCGVAGAYAVVLAVNAYIYTSLSFITLDVLKRFLNTNFNRDFISVPLHDIDFGMITVWVVLGVSGIVLQLCRERTRPFFPPSPYLMWRQARERRKTNVLDPSHHMPPLPGRVRARLQGLFQKSEPAEERTPLLL